MVKEAKRRSWEEFGTNLNETYKTNNRRFWNQVRKLKGNQKKSPRAVKNKNNEVKTTTEEILETWCEYYENKFKGEEKITQEDDMREQEQKKDTTNREMGVITMEEMEEAIMKIKTEKACGSDSIDPEMIKYLGRDGKEWLLGIFRMAWATENIPKDWEDNIFLPIYKKGTT